MVCFVERCISLWRLKNEALVVYTSPRHKQRRSENSCEDVQHEVLAVSRWIRLTRNWDGKQRAKLDFARDITGPTSNFPTRIDSVMEQIEHAPDTGAIVGIAVGAGDISLLFIVGGLHSVYAGSIQGSE